jgi:hypothetical protein
MRGAAVLRICLVCTTCAALQNMINMQAGLPKATVTVSRRQAVAGIASLTAAGLPVSAWAVAQTQVLGF